MIRVAVCPGDRTGCGTYRLSNPAQAVQAVRPDWQIELYDPKAIKIGSKHGKISSIQGLDPYGLDLLVLQRVGAPVALSFLQWAHQHGIAVVMDSDDAMWCIDPDNGAYKAWNSTALHWRYMDQAAKIADIVTVTTAVLAERYGKHGRTEILPNYVPEATTKIESRRADYPAQVATGWAGFVATHPHDLQVVGDGVQRAVAATGAAVRVIGDHKGVDEAFQLPDGTTEGLGGKRLGVEYYSALTALDVAVVPLDDTKFNRGKSNLKALEFSAMGVPVVASPNPANRELAKSLPILIAETPDEWAEHVTRLLKDPDERAERGSRAREIVAKDFTIEGNAEKWALAWERAMRRRRQMG